MVVLAVEFDFRIGSAFENFYGAQRLDFSNNAEIGGKRTKIDENRKKMVGNVGLQSKRFLDFGQLP
jgi:hypothetical protein